jgi:hypothetical protein
VRLNGSIKSDKKFVVTTSYRYGKQLHWQSNEEITVSGSTLRRWIRDYDNHAKNKNGYTIDHSDFWDGATPKPWMQFEYYHNGLLNEIKIEWHEPYPSIMPDWVGPPLKDQRMAPTDIYLNMARGEVKAAMGGY